VKHAQTFALEWACFVGQEHTFDHTKVGVAAVDETGIEAKQNKTVRSKITKPS